MDANQRRESTGVALVSSDEEGDMMKDTSYECITARIALKIDALKEQRRRLEGSMNTNNVDAINNEIVSINFKFLNLRKKLNEETTVTRI